MVVAQTVFLGGSRILYSLHVSSTPSPCPISGRKDLGMDGVIGDRNGYMDDVILSRKRAMF